MLVGMSTRHNSQPDCQQPPQPTEGFPEPRYSCVSTKCLQIELAKVSPRVCLGAEINKAQLAFCMRKRLVAVERKDRGFISI